MQFFRFGQTLLAPLAAVAREQVRRLVEELALPRRRLVRVNRKLRRQLRRRLVTSDRRRVRFL